MASFIDLTWTNTPVDEGNGVLTQEIERKIGSASWAVIESTSVTQEPITKAYKFTDADVTPDVADPLTYSYRIVTVSGAVRTNGNEVDVAVSALPDEPPAAVGDLAGVYRAE